MLDRKHQNILVAIDGSDEAEQAFRKSVIIAKKNNSSLFITHVNDTRALRSFPSFDNPISHNDFMDQTYKEAEATLNVYRKWAEDRKLINVKTILRFGSPKVEIAKNIPKEHHIDLILLGATGLNAVERILIGSVSEYVVRNAPCDVLIVRAHEEEAEDHERITNDDF